MPGYTFHLIPHTHWDREWYLPQTVFLPRLVAALDDLFDRLTAEPELTFLLDGQTVLLEDYLRVRPERAAQAADLVSRGRLQVGPWYVLADELIPSGESLIRNLLAGKSDSAVLGGRTDVFYSPDAFGHPAIWPQLAGEFGIRFGVIWRGLGGGPGQEHDLYRWRGPDGREVLLYHLPPDGYEIGAALPASLDRLPRAWSRVREVLVGRATTRQIAVFVGADHHRLHPAILELRSQLAQLEPDSQFRISRLQDFFGAAAAEANGARQIEGELRWSYGYTWTLQGVHATRAPLKRSHADAELTLLRVAEPLAALCRLFRGQDAGAALRQATRLLLQSEFHDSIGGCTSDEVAARVALRLDDARRLAGEVARCSFDDLIGNDPDRVRTHPEGAEPQVVLWNPVPRRRAGVVVADISWFRRDVLVGPPGDRIPREGPGSRPFHLVNDGQAVGVQRLSRWSAHERLDAALHYPDQDAVDWTRVAFLAPEQQGFGLGRLELGNGERQPGGTAWARGRRLGNELVEVSVASNGSLDVTDLGSRRRYRNLFALESSADEGDTYTFAPPRRDRLRSARAAGTVRVVAAGPAIAAIEVSGRLSAGQSPHGSGSGEVRFRLTVSLYAGSRAVRCSYTIDNQALNHRLRVRVPTGIPEGAALAGSAFGSIERRASDARTRQYPRETPVTTAPAQRYVAHTASGKGLAVFAPGFFEYELDKAGVLRVTLLRSVGQLSRDDLSTRPGHAGWPVATPLAQCLGSDRIQLACVPVSPAQLASGTLLDELWEDLFIPIRPVWLRQALPLKLPTLDIRLEGPGLIFSALKPSEQEGMVVLRCYNSSSRPTAGAWHFPMRLRSAQRARADEQVLHEVKLGEERRSVPFHAAAHEIVTMMVALERPD